MRRGIRAALPAVAVAAALVLTACNGDEEAAPAGDGASEGAGQGGEEQGGGSENIASEGPKPENVSEIEPQSLPGNVTPQDLEDLFPEDLGGLIPWDELEDLVGGDERTPATVEELEGHWYTGPELEDATLDFTNGEVFFAEDWVAEGDLCYGTVTEGSMELTECTVYGEVEWTSMTATLEIEGDALIVTWDDGTEQEYLADESAASM
ncbi:hypothetical protein [Streptomyces sp. B6B3]|uniref:hypothetical protein n=1 Tax=Streptomyces sp. B6B3 TaxID=3153570 RepID=UPI00325E6F4F